MVKTTLEKDNFDISNLNLSVEYEIYVAGNPELFEGDYFTISNNEAYKSENSDSYLELKTIQNKMMQTIYNCYDFDCELSLIPKLKKGDTYVPINSNRFDNDKQEILHLENGVSIIDFWAEWCGPCVSAMGHNYEMIRKNFDNWNGKVKFFTTCGVSKEEKEQTLKFIEEKNWNRFPEVIQHFHAEDNPADIIYGVQSIPFLVIVDKKGVIRHIGNIGGLDVEKLINELLDGKEIEKAEADEKTNMPIDDLIMETFIKPDGFKDEAIKLYKETRSGENEKYNYNMNLVIDFSGKFDLDLQKGVEELGPITKAAFKIKCREKEYVAYNNLLKRHFTQEQIETSMFEIKLMETFNIEIGETNNCKSCQGIIAKEDLTYYCPECKIFFCKQCVDSCKGKSGFEALIHREHYLLVFKNPNPENFKNLDKARLGKNLFAGGKEDELQRDHGFGCNEANDKCTNDTNERYLCMTCRPGDTCRGGYIDFCTNCFNYFCESQEELEKRKDGHEKDHVYMHMIYSGKNYYDY